MERYKYLMKRIPMRKELKKVIRNEDITKKKQKKREGYC